MYNKLNVKVGQYCKSVLTIITCILITFFKYQDILVYSSSRIFIHLKLRLCCIAIYVQLFICLKLLISVVAAIEEVLSQVN